MKASLKALSYHSACAFASAAPVESSKPPFEAEKKSRERRKNFSDVVSS